MTLHQKGHTAGRVDVAQRMMVPTAGRRRRRKGQLVCGTLRARAFFVSCHFEALRLSLGDILNRFGELQLKGASKINAPHTITIEKEAPCDARPAWCCRMKS
jgi:hypothetical protein